MNNWQKILLAAGLVVAAVLIYRGEWDILLAFTAVAAFILLRIFRAGLIK